MLEQTKKFIGLIIYNNISFKLISGKHINGYEYSIEGIINKNKWKIIFRENIKNNAIFTDYFDDTNYSRTYTYVGLEIPSSILIHKLEELNYI